MPTELQPVLKDINFVREFNLKSTFKDGVEAIRKKCSEAGITDVTKQNEQIAIFFHVHKKNLDLQAVSDYLGTQGKGEVESKNHKEILQYFLENMQLQGKDFLESMREFSDSLYLAGIEGQKMMRLLEGFANVYVKQNPEGVLKTADHALQLASTMMTVQTSLHNPQVKARDRMSLQGFQDMIRGEGNFNIGYLEPAFLEGVYNGIRDRELKSSFSPPIHPEYKLNSQQLETDSALDQLNDVLSSPTPGKLGATFSHSSLDNVQLTVVPERKWYHFLLVILQQRL